MSNIVDENQALVEANAAMTKSMNKMYEDLEWLASKIDKSRIKKTMDKNRFKSICKKVKKGKQRKLKNNNHGI